MKTIVVRTAKLPEAEQRLMPLGFDMRVELWESEEGKNAELITVSRNYRLLSGDKLFFHVDVEGFR